MDKKYSKEIFLNKGAIINPTKKSSLKFIELRLEALKSEDEMEVLLNLQELNRELLVATEQIAEDINCQYLIVQLMELFNKFYIPDITMHAIISLNVLLDINPIFTITIIKNGGIPKILDTMTQNIEYIDIAESAIKTIEKISYENPFVLLENDAFCIILNLIEFFELGLRKTAMIACVNMSRGINSLDLIKKFYIPAIPNISNLAKLNGNSDIEKFILDQSILCFYNVIYSIRAYNLTKNDNEIYNQLIQYGILDNLFEVLASFLKILNEDSKNSTNKNLNIYVDTFKNILKVFEILCSQSNDIANLVLNMNILEIIDTILSKELGILDQKAKFGSSNISIFADILALLVSFFPNTNFPKSQQHVQLNKKDNFNTKIMSESNKNFYIYFSEKILSILVKNIVNMPSTTTILEVIHLIELYVTYSPKDQIIIYIDPVKLSNISSKMLDSKDTTYITKILTLVELIMNICPENFIETFIREGVIDNIKGIISYDDSNFYVSEEKSTLNSNIGLKNNKLYPSNIDNNNNNDVLNNEYNSNYSEQYNEYEDEIDFIEKTTKKESVSTITDGKNNTVNNVDNMYPSSSQIPSNQTTPTFPLNPSIVNPDDTSKVSISSIFNQMKSIFTNKTEQAVDYQSDLNLKPQNETIKAISKDEDISIKDKTDVITKSSSTTFGLNNKMSGLNSKKPVVSNKVTLVKIKSKEIIEKFFKDSIKIEEYLKKGNFNRNPQEIFNKLTSLSKIFQEKSEIDEETLKLLFDMLINKNQKLTFYEIEKSGIIENLAKYIDNSYVINLEKTEKLLKSPNGDFLTKIKKIFKILNIQKKNMSDFISTLQYCISSMNCFKLYLYEYENYKNVSHLFFAPLKQQNYKIKIAFNYVKNDILSKDENTDKVLKDLNDYYSQTKQLLLYLDQTDNFASINELLISKNPKILAHSIIKPNIISKKDIPAEIDKQFYDEILSSIKEEDGGESSTKLFEKLIEKNAINPNFEIKNLDEEEEDEEQKQGLNSEENIDDFYKEKSLNSENILNAKSEGYTQNNNKVIIENKALASKYITNFFILVKDVKYKIKSSWTVLDFFREVKALMKNELNNSYDIQVYFEFTHLKEIEDYKINDYDTNNQEDELDLCMLSSTLENIANHQEKLFFKCYSENILGNKALYVIKRASPFFYFIALFELCVNNYSDLFDVKDRIPENILENQKVSSLLTKQVRDPFAISSNTIPTWCKELCQNYPFIASFNARYLFFKTCSFDNKRSMTNLSIFVKNFLGEMIVDEKVLASTNKRKKFKVDRHNLMFFAEKIYHEIGNFNGYLEIDYFNETGTGNGPTLEFYSLFAKEIKEKTNLWYKTTDLSLFPLTFDEKLKVEHTKLFTLIGFIIARGLYDDRLLDIPLNSLFWDIILERPISLYKIIKIDKYLGSSLIDLSKLSLIKDQLLKENDKVILEDVLLYNNKKICEVDLYFTLPGTNIELKAKGSDIQVNSENFEEYIKLIYENICGSGVQDYINAFKIGFNTVFDINYLKCFQSNELEELLCGSINEIWDLEVLTENIIPNHGYNKNSLQYKYLITLLMDMNAVEKKKFLFFVTGCPRLPLGGFKNLNPKLTVVKKNPDIPMENPDIYLPTVMTCQNYLKIPEYSSYEIYKNKLYTAMTEGNNSFHFS